jgi:ferric-dicitrate binding protein FerR (iron transport regulator)
MQIERLRMNKRILTSALALSMCAALACVARAADDKQLQNMKGQVSYQTHAGATKPLGLNSTVVLTNDDYAITGASSLAAVGLPDSSRVLVGSESKIQLGFFTQAESASAKFIVYNGKIRFIVQHPQGAKANYTFQTPTASIAVRGTEGDIESDSKTLRVNVYEVCDPSEPVTVTTKDGKSFQLIAGQSLLAQVVNGIVRAQVQQLTQQMIDQFSPDFGVPTSWEALQSQAVGMAQSQASGAVNNATGGYGNEVVSAVGNIFGHKKSTAAPSPSASPKSDTCTHQ